MFLISWPRRNYFHFASLFFSFFPIAPFLPLLPFSFWRLVHFLCSKSSSLQMSWDWKNVPITQKFIYRMDEENNTKTFPPWCTFIFWKTVLWWSASSIKSGAIVMATWKPSLFHGDDVKMEKCKVLRLINLLCICNMHMHFSRNWFVCAGLLACLLSLLTRKS